MTDGRQVYSNTRKTADNHRVTSRKNLFYFIVLLTGCTSQIKKRMLLSFAASIALIALVMLSGNYMRSNVYYIEKDGWDTAVIPFLVWDVNLNAGTVSQMLNPSKVSEVLTYAICFFFPFTSYVKIELKTYRHQAEENLWKRGATRDIVNATNSTRSEDAGLFIAEVLLSAISGPFFCVRRLYRWWELTKYTRNMNQ